MNHHFKTSQRLQKYLIDIIKSALSSSATNSVKINTNLDCNVPEKDIIRRYYKSLIKFWNEYKNNVDEWTLFYNGFEYAPIIVSYGIKNDYVIMNTELQEQFNKILNNIEDS